MSGNALRGWVALIVICLLLSNGCDYSERYDSVFRTRSSNLEVRFHADQIFSLIGDDRPPIWSDVSFTVSSSDSAQEIFTARIIKYDRSRYPHSKVREGIEITPKHGAVQHWSPAYPRALAVQLKPIFAAEAGNVPDMGDLIAIGSLFHAYQERDQDLETVSESTSRRDPWWMNVLGFGCLLFAKL